MSHEEAEQRRDFDPGVPPADRAKNRSRFFYDLRDANLREINRYAEAEASCSGSSAISTLVFTATGNSSNTCAIGAARYLFLSAHSMISE